MENVEIDYFEKSRLFKVKLMMFEQLIKSFKETRLLEKFKVETEFLKDLFAEWVQERLSHWSTLDSENRMNCFVKNDFGIENSYLNLLNEANRLIIETECMAKVGICGPSQRIDANKENLPWFPFSRLYLPLFRLPRFSGRNEDWLNFESLFRFYIDDNKSLNDVMRFWYLKFLLDFKTSSTTKHFTTYKDLWQHLKSYYFEIAMKKGFDDYLKNVNSHTFF